MARTLNRLGSRAAATLKAPGLHADGGGLYLRIDPPTAKEKRENPDAVGPKRWVFIFQWRGKRTEMGLGPAASVLVKDARDARDAARKLLDEGLNPVEVRKAAKETVPDPPAVKTFGAVADEWYEARKAEWTSETARARWRNIIKVHCAPLRPLPIDAVGTTAVEEALKPIWERLPETAPRVRAGIEDILDAAKVRGLRSGENPARWKGHLKHVLSAPKKLTRGHHPALPYPEMPAFLAELRARTASSARLVEFTILTASRPTEAREASWAEFDLKEKLWTVPPERMKLKKEHRVPLSPAAISLLDGLADLLGKEGWIFPGAKEGRPLSNMAGDKLLEMMGRGAYTVHGFRSAFRDWAGDETDFPREVIEAALAHVAGNATERAYRRADALEKRRKLMDAWAEYLGPKPRAGRGAS